MPKRSAQSNHTHTDTVATISIRNMNTKLWREFKKLAMIHELTILEYMKKLILREMDNVQISKKK